MFGSNIQTVTAVIAEFFEQHGAEQIVEWSIEGHVLRVITKDDPRPPQILALRNKGVIANEIVVQRAKKHPGLYIGEFQLAGYNEDEF
jgi:hypothetical protein